MKISIANMVSNPQLTTRSKRGLITAVARTMNNVIAAAQRRARDQGRGIGGFDLGILAKQCCDVSALYLTGGRARKSVDYVYGLGDFEIDEVLLAEGLDVLLRNVSVDHDSGVDFFAEFFVRDAEAYGVLHGGMLGKDCVDLQGSDLLAAAVDQLLQPARYAEVSEIVEEALVACPEPAVGKGGGVGLVGCCGSPS